MAIAANGREALECLNRTRFDLVLMDLQMPEMDGPIARACTFLKTAAPRTL